jgi:Uma2 family endonuclease
MIRTMRARPIPRMTSDQFIDWATHQPCGRFELVAGEVVAMSPERTSHTKVKLDVAIALRQAIATAGLPCEAYTDGTTVKVDDHHTYEPDALVRCGGPLDDDPVVIPDPLILVEVVSRSSAGTDSGAKLANYFRLPTVRHYLIVEPSRRTVIHHRRAEDGEIATRIVGEGALRLEPPGIEVEVERFFEGLAR